MPQIFSCYSFLSLQKPLLGILSLLLLLSSNLHAKSYAPISTDCDTLITLGGKEMLVVVKRTTMDEVYYSDCGDTSGQVKQMNRSDVRHIGLNEDRQRHLSKPPQGATPYAEKLYDYPHLGPLGLGFSIVGLILLGIFALLFILPTFCLIFGFLCSILGAIFSYKFLLDTRHSKRLYKRKRNKAVVGAVIGTILSSLILFSIALVVFLDW